jgi:hypothetical protein
MPLYQIEPTSLKRIGGTTFAEAGVMERFDLQRLLCRQIEVICPDALVLTEEFADWEDSRRSIDILCLDKDAALVVIELKRTDDGGHMELQALRYAAMVSEMTFDQAADAHALYLAKCGRSEDARGHILEFLEWDQPNEEKFARDVRIVLAAANFSREITTAVLWLNDRNLDIRCVRMSPYSYEGRVLLDVQQVIPLPEAAEYQIRVKAKVTRERASRQEERSKEQRFSDFWSSLLARANARTSLHANISPSQQGWIATTSQGLRLCYVLSRGWGWVELYINRPDREENKAIFDDLVRYRQEVEQSFGAVMEWDRMDDKLACRIDAKVVAGSLADESTWEPQQEAMVDAMIRFEMALRPFVQKYRDGARAVTKLDPSEP